MILFNASRLLFLIAFDWICQITTNIAILFWSNCVLAFKFTKHKLKGSAKVMFQFAGEEED